MTLFPFVFYEGKKLTAKARSLKQATKKLTVPKAKEQKKSAKEASPKPAPDESKERVEARASCFLSPREWMLLGREPAFLPPLPQDRP